MLLLALTTQTSMVKASLMLFAFLLIASCSQFRRMVGAEAQNERYKCTQDAECQDKCDANHCKAICLELPSICISGLCACPFGPEHSAVKVISTSTCSGDGDCTKFCPIECSIKNCMGGKCSCGCHG